jgi:subtilisin family serine protease
MKLKICFLVLSLFVCTTISSITNKVNQKTVRVSNKLYIESQNTLFEVDTTLITVKPKKCVSELKTEVNIKNSNRLGYLNVRVPKGIDVEHYRKMLDETREFETVEYNGKGLYAMTPNDAIYSNQWNLGLIHASEAWNITTGSPNIKIAIIDSGVDAGHQYFAI